MIFPGSMVQNLYLNPTVATSFRILYSRCQKFSYLSKYKYQQSIHQQDLAYQGLIDASSFAKADCDAIEAKHGEVEHGEADSSKAEAVLGKELESSDCERGNMRTAIPFFSGTCVFRFPTQPL